MSQQIIFRKYLVKRKIDVILIQEMNILKKLLKKYSLFFSESFSNFGTVGAIAPSSNSLAKAVVNPMGKRTKAPIAVLEVGPGTGAFTSQILRELQQGDTLDIYELNPKFYQYLKNYIDQESILAKKLSCKLYNADIRHLNKSKKYDFIISGLPFNNFDFKTVDEILSVLMSQLTPNGIFTYFEYCLTNEFKGHFLKSIERERMLMVGLTVKTFIQKYQFHSTKVWLNLPPAIVHYCKKTL